MNKDEQIMIKLLKEHKKKKLMMTKDEKINILLKAVKQKENK